MDLEDTSQKMKNSVTQKLDYLNLLFVMEKEKKLDLMKEKKIQKTQNGLTNSRYLHQEQIILEQKQMMTI